MINAHPSKVEFEMYNPLKTKTPMSNISQSEDQQLGWTVTSKTQYVHQRFELTVKVHKLGQYITEDNEKEKCR